LTNGLVPVSPFPSESSCIWEGAAPLIVVSVRGRFLDFLVDLPFLDATSVLALRLRLHVSNPTMDHDIYALNAKTSGTTNTPIMVGTGIASVGEKIITEGDNRLLNSAVQSVYPTPAAAESTQARRHSFLFWISN
jgi:hypothetical protein